MSLCLEASWGAQEEPLLTPHSTQGLADRARATALGRGEPGGHSGPQAPIGGGQLPGNPVEGLYPTPGPLERCLQIKFLELNPCFY